MDQNDKMLKIFQIVYPQYMEHARHQETKRSQFLNYFILVVVGIFAILFTERISGNFLNFVLLAFVIIFSILGILATISWRVVFLEHFLKARKILSKVLDLEEKQKEFLTYTEPKERRPKKPATAFKIVLTFYIFFLTFSVFFIIWFATRECVSWSLIGSISFLIVCSWLVCKLAKKYEEPFKGEERLPPPII